MPLDTLLQALNRDMYPDNEQFFGKNESSMEYDATSDKKDCVQ